MTRGFLAASMALAGAVLVSQPSQLEPRFFPLQVEGQSLRIAYRDQLPIGPANGQTVVLLHGKNFSGFYWERVMSVLAAEGFRVIAPDQLGFGASSRPDLHYSFHQMAGNTKALLDSLGIRKIVLVGHSMGGMLAVRFALLYPGTVNKLVLENPIGLEDYRLFVPYVPLERQIQSELAVTLDSIRAYQKTYYVAWKPEFEPYVQDQAASLASGEFPRAALASALTYQMIYLQPVVHELSALKPPTLLIIGQEDRTVVGKGLLAPEQRSRYGHYPQLGRSAQAAIKGSRLAEIAGAGHIPHIEQPDRFDEALSAFLKP